MHPKDAEGIANSVDPDQTAIWVCTVCPDLSVRKLRNITSRKPRKHLFPSRWPPGYHKKRKKKEKKKNGKLTNNDKLKQVPPWNGRCTCLLIRFISCHRHATCIVPITYSVNGTQSQKRILPEHVYNKRCLQQETSVSLRMHGGTGMRAVLA